MNKFKIVVKNVFLQNLKSPVFLWMLFGPILLFGIGFMISSNANSKSAKIAVVSTDSSLSQTFTNFNSKNTKYVVDYKSEAAAKKALVNQKIDGYLKVTKQSDDLKADLYDTNQSHKISEEDLQLAINQIDLNFKAQSMNLPPTSLKKIVTPPDFNKHHRTVSHNRLVTQNEDKNQTKIVAIFIISMIFYVLNLFYMMQMATNIGNEKGDRVMEIILSSTNSKVQFLGEVIGIFLTMTTQLIIYGFMGLAAKQLFADNKLFKNFSWNYLISPELLFAVLFGLIGVFLYLVLAAMLGSLVNNLEQVNQAVTPLTFPTIIAFILAVTSIVGGVTPLVKIFAFIPLFSQLIAPVLLVLGNMTWVEAVISLVIELVSTVLVSIFVGKMYQANVLVYSQKGVWDSLKTSAKLLKSNNS